jgi:DNA-binding MarR family transcriptional regulator
MSELSTVKFTSIFNELVKEYPDVSTEALQTALEFKMVAAKMESDREELFQHFGITPGRFHLLMILKGEVGYILSPSELAKRTNVTRATMTQFVDALEKEEFVRRTDDPKDRRGMLVQLTDKGLSKLKEILPHYYKKLTGFTGDLSGDERDTLLMLMKKIKSNGLN